MSTTKKKIGDRIRITGGQFKDKVGVITGKERRGWTVELEAYPGDGGERRQINVPFPLAAPVEASAQAEQAGGAQAQKTTDAESTAAEAHPAADPTAGTTVQPDRTGNAADRSIQADANADEPGDHPSATGGNEPADIPACAGGNPHADRAKLTVKQLQALAKQRGIGIARTKADFLRIIAAKHPGEDLQRLKGKALFDRVGELHISRLRSKADLMRLLQAS